MRLGNRNIDRIARALRNPAVYRAALRMPLVFESPAGAFKRYVTGAGSYPYRCVLRTPTADAAPLLYSADDLVTVNEIFCRHDYGDRRDTRVIVDIGANIGIAALFFLTRNHACRVYCYEPNPTNVERLRGNLTGYEGRLTIEEVAVGVDDGEVAFGIEPTGRYGRIDADDMPLITVRCRDINGILDDVLSLEQRIDVLKIDTEGYEQRIVGAIRADLLDRIGALYYETNDPEPFHTDRFRHRFVCKVNELTARQ